MVGVDMESETVTPTGAAIVRTLGKKFGDQPAMTIEKHRLRRRSKGIYQSSQSISRGPRRPTPFLQTEEMLVIETNIDDMNPQFYDHAMDRLFAAGARDVFLTPIQMKKNRPATLLRVIAEPRDREKLAGTFFRRPRPSAFATTRWAA